MIKFAKPEEIQYAHSILLKDKPYFEQDKIDIIECNESQDVKACPGSEKTTTLLAKLIILANRMPLPNNQGICVLTHTNVAIDEIKNKKKPSQISNDAYVKNLNRSFKVKSGQIKKSNESLYNRMYHFFMSNEGLLDNVRLSIKNSDLNMEESVRRSSISERLSKRDRTFFKQIYENIYEQFSQLYSSAEEKKYNLIRVDSTVVSDISGKMSEGLENNGRKSMFIRNIYRTGLFERRYGIAPSREKSHQTGNRSY